MFAKNVRNVLLIGAGILTLAAVLRYARVIGVILVVWLVIFLFARVSGRDSRKEKSEKEPDKSRVVDEAEEEPSEKETDPYKAAQAHVKAISASLFKICCMDIRNAGMRSLRIARDIIREKYEEKKDCKGYAQFERYYLPTFRKTVDNYGKMEQKGIVDLKIRSDMQDYLESCEEAFSKLYASMFSDDILNMEVQMEAMNITMKRDGLL